MIAVVCKGLPVFDFPIELIDPKREHQVVHVPFIVYRGVTYGSGAYVALKRRGNEFEIENVALQQHLL